MFQPILWYFQKIATSNNISAQKSKGFSDEIIKPPSASNHSPTLLLNHSNTKIKLVFDGSCFKNKKKMTFTHKKVVNVYIV